MMFQYPTPNPIAFSLGALHVHWYGLMYLLGFALAWGIGLYQAKRIDSGWTATQVADLLFYGALGVVLGGRLGYMLFYNFTNLIADPFSAVKVWQGGMSFHGGFLGVLLAVFIFGKVHKKSFIQVTDFIAPMIPLGLAAGRLGNFINGELWGRITNVPWAMIFLHVDQWPRHPSQLYAILGEGFLLFVILMVYARKPRPAMAVSSLFLMGYGSIRFVEEFFREPDPQLGFIAFDWLTMGQLLSLPMILLGLLLWVIAHSKQSGEQHQCNSI